MVQQKILFIYRGRSIPYLLTTRDSWESICQTIRTRYNLKKVVALRYIPESKYENGPSIIIKDLFRLYDCLNRAGVEVSFEVLDTNPVIPLGFSKPKKQNQTKLIYPNFTTKPVEVVKQPSLPKKEVSNTRSNTSTYSSDKSSTSLETITEKMEYLKQNKPKLIENQGPDNHLDIKPNPLNRRPELSRTKLPQPGLTKNAIILDHVLQLMDTFAIYEEAFSNSTTLCIIIRILSDQIKGGVPLNHELLEHSLHRLTMMNKSHHNNNYPVNYYNRLL